jgi:hypothetical protein
MSTFTEINDTLKQIRYDLKANISTRAASGADKAKNFIPKTVSTMLDAAKDSIIQEIPAGRLLVSAFSDVRAYFKNMKKSKEESKEGKQTHQETTLSDINSTIKAVGFDIADELKTLELMPALLKAVEDLKCSNQSKRDSTELKTIEGSKDSKELKTIEGSKELKTIEGSKELKTIEGSKDSKELKTIEGSKDSKELKTIEGIREPIEGQFQVLEKIYTGEVIHTDLVERELKAIESIREPIEGQFQVLENMADIAYEQLMDNKEAVDRGEVSAIKDKKPETSFIVGEASKIINPYTSSLLSNVGLLLSAIELGLIGAVVMLKDKIFGWIKNLGKMIMKLTPIGRIAAIGLLLFDAFDYIFDHMDKISEVIKDGKKFLIDGVADLWNNTAGNLPGAKKLVSDGENLTFVTKEEFDRNKVSGLGSTDQQSEQNTMIQKWINYLTGNGQSGNSQTSNSQTEIQTNRQLLEKNLNNIGRIELDDVPESNLYDFKQISPVESLDTAVTTESRRLADTKQSQLNTQQSNQSNNNLNIGGSSNSSNISIFNTQQNNKPMR